MEAVPWLLTGILTVLVIANWSAISKVIKTTLGLFSLLLFPIAIAGISFAVFKRYGFAPISEVLNSLLIFAVQGVVVALGSSIIFILVTWVSSNVWVHIKAHIIINNLGKQVRPILFVSVWLGQLIAFVILYMGISILLTEGVSSWLKVSALIYLVVMGIVYHQLLVLRNLSLLEIVQLAVNRLIK